MTTQSWMELKSITLNGGAQPPQRPWPEGASDEYASARSDLLEAEMALRDQGREVARMRSELPSGAPMKEYTFAEGPRDLDAEEPVAHPTLLDLFGDTGQLLVYHLMFHPDDDAACAMCSMWVDGLHGVSHHIAAFGAFAVVGRAPLPKLRGWARRRGWDGLRIVSSYESSFNADLQVEGPSGGQWPGVSVFERDGDEVRHVITQTAPYPDGTNRGIDLLSPVWHILDLMPSGRQEWLPDNAYPGRARG
jgi:predicted dithiol-disulfide oxidoreductase (DUF899 family)